MTDQPDSDSYHGYSVDEENQPQGNEDSQSDDRGLEDPLDEGYSPPEKWSSGQGWGNTPLEEELGESLDQRLAAEVPEPDPYVQAAEEAADPDVDATGERVGSEAGDVRAGRLVEPDEGVREDRDSDLVADDIGIDGAGAGAEEAAVHVVDED